MVTKLSNKTRALLGLALCTAGIFASTNAFAQSTDAKIKKVNKKLTAVDRKYRSLTTVHSSQIGGLQGDVSMQKALSESLARKLGLSVIGAAVSGEVLAGAQGPVGPQGPAGLRGEAGLQGPAGAQGAMGPQGVAGPAGARGATGSTGAQGAQGIQGIQGIQGVAGPAGARGERGLPGSNPTVNLSVASGQCATLDIGAVCGGIFGCRVLIHSDSTSEQRTVGFSTTLMMDQGLYPPLAGDDTRHISAQGIPALPLFNRTLPAHEMTVGPNGTRRTLFSQGADSTPVMHIVNYRDGDCPLPQYPGPTEVGGTYANPNVFTVRALNGWVTSIKLIANEN